MRGWVDRADSDRVGCKSIRKCVCETVCVRVG